MIEAKGKVKKKARDDDAALADSHAAKVSGRVTPRDKAQKPSDVSAGVLRGIAAESMARVYTEIWPSMKTRDSRRDDQVDPEISEEAYILMLTMFVGNPTDLPRKELKIRHAEITDGATFCQEHS